MEGQNQSNTYRDGLKGSMQRHPVGKEKRQRESPGMKTAVCAKGLKGMVDYAVGGGSGWI